MRVMMAGILTAMGRWLLNITVVVFVVFMIWVFVLPGYLENPVRADYDLRKRDMRAIAQAMEAYRAAWGAYPASEKDSPLAGHGTGIEIDQRLLTTPVAYLPKILSDGFREKAEKKNRRQGAGVSHLCVGITG